MAAITVKRAYQPPEDGDGCRVLIDRLWPRGVSKDRAAVDHWFKALAPSAALRRWFGHDPDKWDEFRRRYHAELAANAAALAPLLELVKTQPKITLLFGAKDEAHNNAVALAQYLRACGTR